MTTVTTIAVQRAEALLKAAGVEYAIKMPDGSTRGTLKLAPEPTKITRKRGHKPGTIQSYIEQFVKRDAAPGSVVVIPYKPELGDEERMQGWVTSWATRHFGSGGAYITHRNDKGVELLRIS